MVNNPAANSEVAVAVNAEDNASGAIDGIIGSLDSLNGKAMAVAGGGIAALSAALAGEAVRAAASFEDAIIDLQKVAGEDTAAALEDDIQSMAESIPLTAEQLAGLAAEAARFGIEGEENIKSFVKNTAQMATATTLNTNEAASAFSKLSELTNTPVSEVENLGSSINTLSNNFATSSQEIVDASLRSAGALSQLGLEQTEIFTLTTSLNEVSESSERAGTRLRRLAQEIQDADPSALAEPLGLSVDEFERLRSESPEQLIQQIASTFADGGKAADTLRSEFSSTSRQAVAGLAQNLEGLKNASETSQDAFDSGTSIQEEFAQETSKTTSQLQLLKSEINNVKRNLGEDLLPALKDGVSVLSDAVSSFQSLNDSTDGMAAKMGLAGTAVTGVALALGGVLSLLSGPLFAAVAGIAAAIGAAAIAWQRDIGGIRDKTRAAMRAIKAGIQRALTAITQLWNTHGDSIIQSVNQILDLIRFGWENMGKQIVATLKAALDLAIAVLKPGLSNLLEAFDLVTDLLTGDWQGAWNSVKSIVRTSLDQIVSVFRQGVGLIKQVLKLVVDAILLPFKFVKKQLIGNSIIPEIIDGIVKLFKNAPSRIKTAVSKVGDAIINALPSFGDLVSVGQTAVDGLVKGLKNGIKKVGEAAGELAGEARDHFLGSDAEKGPLSDFSASTEKLGTMPAEGLRSGIGDVEQAAGDLAASAAETTTTGGEATATAGGQATVSPADIQRALGGMALALDGSLDVDGNVATMDDVDAKLKREGRRARNRGVRQ